MKRILLAIVLILLLSGCGNNEESSLHYDEADFVFEVNQQQVDLMQYIYTTDTIILDDSFVQYGMIGKYKLYLTDVDTDIEYEIPVIIEDTTGPVIEVSEDFEFYYDPGAELDLSEIITSDNSNENIDYISNIEEIDMSDIGEKSLVITAQDSSGNLTVKEIKIYVRVIVYPELDIIVYNLSNTSLTILFDIDDPLNYRVDSYYSVTQDGSVIATDKITNPTVHLDGLLQDTEYRITLLFTYSIPGQSQAIISKIETVTTISLFEPIVELDDVLIASDSLSFLVDLLDPDNLLGDVQVTVKDSAGVIINQEIVGEIPEFNYSELNLEEEYTVILTYSYDLLDGRGVQEYTEEYTYQLIE